MSHPDAPSPATRGTYDAVAPSVFDADPALGLDTHPRGGLEGYSHHDAGSTSSAGSATSAGRATASSVRPAREADLEALGAVHAAVMRASLDTAHRATHGRPVPPELLALIDPQVLAAGWHDAVAAPPSPAHQVLVAVEAGQVVGLVALAPTQGRAVEVDADGQPVRSDAEAGTGARDAAADTWAADEAGAHEAADTRVRDAAADEAGVEIVALGVAPSRQRAGHGSRLLAAATDTARQAGATTLLVWAVRGDDSLASLLTAAGLERTRSHRELPVGDGVTEDCWAAAL